MCILPTIRREKKVADKAMFGFSLTSLIFSLGISFMFGAAYAIVTCIVGDVLLVVAKFPLVLAFSLLDKSVGISEFAVAFMDRLNNRDSVSGEAIRVFLNIICFAVSEILLVYLLLDGVLRWALLVASLASYYIANKLFCRYNGRRRRKFTELVLLVVAIFLRVLLLPLVYLVNIIAVKIQKMYKMKTFCSTLSLDKPK